MAVLAFAKVSNDADYEQSAFWLEVFRENEYSNGDRGGHIQKLNCYPAFTSAYDECRGKEAIQETTNAPKGFETDNLASLTYHVFPKYFVTPFHYDPVAQK